MTVAGILALLALAAIAFLVLRRRSRRAPPPNPPPQAGEGEAWGNWRQHLDHVPHLHLLSVEQRTTYDRRVEEFLQGKRFVGCDGLEVTDEMRAVVAGLACLLILRPQAQAYPRLRSVLIYPEAFLVPQSEPDEFGLVSDEPEERIGESWSGDRVILSWPEVEAALAGDEVNVVAHEFAHQLDDAKGGAEGAPRAVDAQRWAEVMRAEYQRLQRSRRPPVLDPYGAESPAEFFAVATEAYFQRGAELQKHHPALYELLRDYYLLDTTRLEVIS
jgi:hypothetical protein